jgi:hypothetical protein
MVTINARKAHLKHLSSSDVHWNERKVLTMEDWEIHYPVFRQLYITEQRTLDDTICVMKERLNFAAT